MKKSIFPVIALALSLVILLCACGQDPVSNGPCVHTDSNGDYICDACQEKLQPTQCASHTDTDEDYAGDICGTFVDAAVDGWLLEGIPTYKGGALSEKLYVAGQGIDAVQLPGNENLMQAVSCTTKDEFTAYLAKLEKAGYTKEFYREADQNLFASYIKGDVRVYTYFMSRTGIANIIKENVKISSSLSDFGYSYEKKQGEQSVLYQFALPMRDETHTKETDTRITECYI